MSSDGGPPNESVTDALSAETTIELMRLARGGNRDAVDRLVAHCLPALRRWAHVRLPPSAHESIELPAVLREIAASVIERMAASEPCHQGRLQIHLRRALLDRINDFTQGYDGEASSLLESTAGAESIARYEAALDRMSAADREAIVGRLELQYSYEELALVLDQPSANEARAAVARALSHLAAEIADGS